MSCDGFSGEPESLRNSPNTGFYYVKSTNRTVQMLRYWRTARQRLPVRHDQKVFDDVKLGVRIAFLDTVFFATFCASRGGVYTVHANCCIGQENKGPRTGNVIAAWKNYTSLAPSEKESGKVRWPYPSRCRAARVAKPIPPPVKCGRR